jgi:thioredoxin reductase
MGECVFNKPNIEGLEHLENKQIFYFPTNSHTYENKNILIFGGGDSALDAVECLYKKNNVSLIHRRNTFKAMASKTNFLNFIKLYSPFNIKSLNTTEKILTSLTIENEEKQVTLECDYIFFCYGYNSGLMPEKIPVTIDNMQSHEKGLFAVGGISTYEQKRELITSGMWECRIVLENLLI